MKKHLLFAVWLLAVSILAVIVWYSPTLFKGYSYSNIRENVVLARNLSQTGVFGSEDKLNITLASSLLHDRAQTSSSGGKLTAIFYSKIFDLFGAIDAENLVLVTIAILVLAMMFFSLTIYLVFDLKTAMVFSLIYIFFPFNWYHANSTIGEYDTSLFFISIFSLLFFASYFSKSRNKIVPMVLAGVMLAFSGIAKETFFALAVSLFIYLIWQKKWQIMAYVFIPFFIIISLFWLPSFISGQNSYLSLFSQRGDSASDQFVSWSNFSHLYPDPYTYHFDRQSHLSGVKATLGDPNEEFLNQIGTSKVMTNLGEAGMGVGQRSVVGTTLLVRHLGRFFSFQDMGGPWVLLLVILGIITLMKRNKKLSLFFGVLFVFTLIFISYIVLGVRNHVIDFNWVIVLLTTLGLFFLSESISKSLGQGGRREIFVLSCLVLLLIYGLILSNHAAFSQAYNQPHHLALLAYAKEINESKITDDQIIAVNVVQYQIDKLSYLTNKSMVVFAPETVKKLIAEDKLTSAFNTYGIKYILGYSPELTGEILAKTDVKSIGDSSLSIDQPQLSKTKSWLMNLLK